jgi:hypothetical protein
MPRIELNSDPYELELYCPFCGEQIIGTVEGEGFSETCEHTVCVGFDDPGEEDIRDTDIVFVAYEGAPASREHIFAFREPS